MASKWYFTQEELSRSPSAKVGISASQELDYKRQAAFLISDMAQLLKVSQPCINTAIVFMHRFYAYHPQSTFNKRSVACAVLFLAAKIKETPVSSEMVVKTMHLCLDKNLKQVDIYSEDFKQKVSELITNESILLTTLGFVTEIENPHYHVLEFCQRLKMSTKFTRLAYKIATHCLQLTAMCLRFTPKDIAVFCLHLTNKCSQFKIQNTVDGRSWLQSLSSDDILLWKMDEEFKSCLDMCSSRVQTSVMSAFVTNSVSPPSEKNGKTEDQKPFQLSQISFDEYIARKRNLENKSDSNNNSGDNSVNCNDKNVFIKSVPISDKTVACVENSSLGTTDTVSGKIRKRKESSDLNDLSAPAKEFKPS